MCRLATSVSSLEKCLFRSNAHLKNNSVYSVVLAVLSLGCCASFSLVAAGGGYPAARVLRAAVASLAVERRPEGAWCSVVAARGRSGCGSRALEHRLSSCA